MYLSWSSFLFGAGSLPVLYKQAGGHPASCIDTCAEHLVYMGVWGWL